MFNSTEDRLLRLDFIMGGFSVNVRRGIREGLQMIPEPSLRAWQTRFLHMLHISGDICNETDLDPAH